MSSAENLTSLTATELLRKGRSALRRGDEATARACVRTLKGRRTGAAKDALETLTAGLRAAAVRAPKTRGTKAAATPPRGWVAKAKSVAREFEPDDGGDRSVYVVLFDREGELGLYVGLTGLTVRERFANHKAGHKASRVVRDYGVRVLDEVAKHLYGNLSQTAAVKIEKRLAKRLRAEGFLVEGGK